MIKKITFLFSLFASSVAAAEGSCFPFKVHLHIRLPRPPKLSSPKILPKNWEPTISSKIGKIKTQNEFPRLYKNWLKDHPSDLSEIERYQWLRCLLYYVSIDTNRNGIPDWSAIIDNQPTQVLFPEDPDQDGDEIPNVFDPKPLTPTKIEKAVNLKEIPEHLIIDSQKRPEASLLQEQLFKEFGIFALDHTDEQSPVVLRELLYLLQKSFTKEFISGLNIKYIYAFAGHDPKRNIASYHRKANALSVGGISSYSDYDIKFKVKIDLLSTLAHEIGHAVLFEKLSPNDLANISKRFSDWNTAHNSELSGSFFSPIFFEPFKFKSMRNIVSAYAMKNRHEWFAESFAAAVLHDLGESGALNDNWQDAITKKSFNSSEYWVDYTKISNDFRDWFKLLIKN